MYSGTSDAVDRAEFAQRGRGDRHQFRFVLAPEDAAELEDLKGFTRELMGQLERDLGTGLDWVAVDHWDTDNPHTHIVVRGKDEAGQNLIISGEYISHGMRNRASELSTRWLGLRTEREIRESLNREVGQERWTRIDGSIQERAIDGVVDLNARVDTAPAQFDRGLKIGRLRRLERMGLAEETRANAWTLDPKAEATLKSWGERGDIIRTMQRAFTKVRREFDLVGLTGPATPIVGRIAAKGLSEELTDRRYVIVDGIDGTAHHIVLPTKLDAVELPVGGIVEIRSITAPRQSDLTIARLSEAGIYRTERHIHFAHEEAKAGQSPEALVQTHERRLEALRRAGIVDRLDAGVWRVPLDLAERGLQYDIKANGGVEVNILSALPIGRQVSAIGAT